MSLNKPIPGLRPTVRVRHNAKSPKRVEIVVPGLAEMDLPRDVADQMTRADSHFEQVDEVVEVLPDDEQDPDVDAEDSPTEDIPPKARKTRKGGKG